MVSQQILAREISWQSQLAQAVSDVASLCHALDLPDTFIKDAQLAASEFKIRVPWAYVKRIKPGNPDDPLLKQVLPISAEIVNVEGYVLDPLDEKHFRVLPGLIHKYENRILLIASGGCAIHCRYCFRRHFPYQDNLPNPVQWQTILGYINAHPEINEVIFSGGDPLVSSDQRLSELIQSLETIKHLKRLRWHTRLPVVIPARITESFVTLLKRSSLQQVMVFHINHAQEIDSAVIKAAKLLQNAGVKLFNQSVLLKTINDDVQTLAELSETLFEAGIVPYYLHQLDPVAGAAHFNVSDECAVALMKDLRSRLAGFLVPKLVRELPGERSKTPVE